MEGVGILSGSDNTVFKAENIQTYDELPPGEYEYLAGEDLGVEVIVAKDCKTGVMYIVKTEMRGSSPRKGGRFVIEQQAERWDNLVSPGCTDPPLSHVQCLTRPPLPVRGEAERHKVG